MGEIQKTSNSECYTPSSEPFRIYVNRGPKDELNRDADITCEVLHKMKGPFISQKE
jgi:hypothetical protein